MTELSLNLHDSSAYIHKLLSFAFSNRVFRAKSDMVSQRKSTLMKDGGSVSKSKGSKVG